MTTASPSAFASKGRNRRILGAIVLILASSACTSRTVMNFNRLDGRTDQAALAQFHQDDAICKGEVAKAQAVAAPIYMGRNLADAMEACWRGSATMRSGRSWSAAWLSAATP